jgi:hypothetical protein
LKNVKKSVRIAWRKSIYLAALFGALTLFVAVPSHSHLPDGRVFEAFQFPSGLAPQIDGDLSDWALVGDSYIITTGQLRDLVGGVEVDPADFTLRMMVGWAKEQNRLYIAAEVRDDLHQIDRPAGSAAARIFQDDAFEVFVDADHSGGQFANFTELSAEEQLLANGVEANHFVVAGPPPDDDFFVNYSAASWYALEDGPYTSAALRFEGTVGGASVTRYEIALVPFDRIDVNAVFLSVEHVLQEGEIIGFNAEFDDYDLLSEFLDAKWSLSGELNSYRFSERFADLMLMPLETIFLPTVVEDRSWGRIKWSLMPGE